MNGNSNQSINIHFLPYRTDYGKVEPEPQEPDNIRATIIVSILKDQITIMPVGGSMSLSCSGRLRSNNVSESSVSVTDQASMIILYAGSCGGQLVQARRFIALQC